MLPQEAPAPPCGRTSLAGGPAGRAGAASGDAHAQAVESGVQQPAFSVGSQQLAC